MKTLAVMQPYFLPYPGYFQLVAASDQFVLFDDVNFIKKGWIHRNRFQQPDGRESCFTLPINGASQNRLISELSLVQSERWRRKLLDTVRHCYRKAPYFEQVFPWTEQIIRYDSIDMVDFIENSLCRILEYLDLQTPLIRSSRMQVPQNLRGQMRILEICEILGAKRYVNPCGGVELYDRQLFKSYGIDLRFLSPKLPQYDRLGFRYECRVSILDMLMFVSQDLARKLIREYELQ